MIIYVLRYNREVESTENGIRFETSKPMPSDIFSNKCNLFQTVLQTIGQTYKFYKLISLVVVWGRGILIETIIDSLLVSFPVTVIKYSDQRTLQKKGVVLTHRLQSIIARRLQQQEVEEAGHIESTTRTERNDKHTLTLVITLCSAPFPYFIQPKIFSLRNCLVHN